MSATASDQAYLEAKELFPGGVNSPVRSFRAVGGTPVFFDRARGARLFDSEGRPYLDFVQGWGTHILGHRPASVVRAVRRQAGLLMGAGVPTTIETELAREIRNALPSMERLRFVNSGTEAVMSAVRVARAATARPLIIKFDGAYHGHSDGLLVQAGSGLSSLGLPSSSGVDPRQASGTISIPFNDLTAVGAAFEARPDKIAAILVEPVCANMGVVLPRPGFLAGLKRLCHQHGALLIFDEVITGFRVAFGGAQGLYDIVPDLTTLGKIIGGGLPIGAYGGRKELMNLVSPMGPVYQAGTLAGNPISMAAGLAVLRQLRRKGFYERLEERSGYWTMGLRQLLPPGRAVLNSLGPLFTLFFNRGSVTDFTSANTSDQDAYARFFHGMLGRGIFLPPSAFEAGFLGAGHTKPLLKAALRAAEDTLTALHY